ncbi:MAG: hypothetical protein ACLTND_13445 [Ruminococcus bicirculans (ex Wegman et al. 2014)]|uniref:hypothetical protein n=1 Tax=Ruminococcus bicirculans (ex Wegman et al. 2014) TaxID=1160721 RepID=UPI00399301AF
MNYYAELLNECNACICSGVLSEQKKFCHKLMILDQQYLTTVQREYLIMKIDNCISSYYNSLSKGRFYSSRNNNERTDIAVLNRTAMYLGNMENSRNKGLLLKALLKTLSHNKAKFEPYEYDRLLAEIIISAFKT